MVTRVRSRHLLTALLECLGHTAAIWVLVTWVWQFLPTFTTRIQNTLPITVDSQPALVWHSQIQINLGSGTASVPGQFWGPMRLQLTVGAIGQDQAQALGRISDVGGLVAPLLWLSLARLGEVLVAATVIYLVIFACLRSYLLVQSHLAHPPWLPALVAVALTFASTVSGAVAGVLALDTRGSISAAAQIAGSLPRSAATGSSVPGVQIAAVGDSRIGYWSAGRLISTAADDYACTRTSDSLAAQLAVINSAPGLGQTVRAANLACTGATSDNFFEPQQVIRTLPQQGDIYHVPATADGRHGVFTVPSQLSGLQQFPDLKVVVVAFGPNDLGWTTQLGMYVAAQRESGSVPNIKSVLGDLARTDWQTRRSQFLVDLNLGLLPTLSDLPSRPAIVVLGSYDLFGTLGQPGSCRDAAGFSAQNLQDIHDHTVELNDLLRGAVADANVKLAPDPPRFTFVQPRLAPLCSPAGQAAPDLNGMTQGYPFHPTALGEAHIAAAVQPFVAGALAAPDQNSGLGGSAGARAPALALGSQGPPQQGGSPKGAGVAGSRRGPSPERPNLAR
jgi:hypothetical protein